MNHTEHLTYYVAHFIDELAKSGVEQVVISPGSRSTPLAMLVAQHPTLKEWILVDERSAGFFALGMAKKSRTPVALICTSGTAAANYLPAVTEAYYSRVPLLVLTADRPHELRGVGAPQTINQMNMYQHFVKEYFEMALPEATPAMLNYVRNRAARAVTTAGMDNPGPVQLNFPFREPLVPDFTLENIWGTRATTFNPVIYGEKTVQEADIQYLSSILNTHEKGMIVCGPDTEEGLATSVVELSEKLQIPILADPLSQLRAGNHKKSTIITGYDAMFREPEIRERVKPAYIIRFGAMPTSKSYRFFAEEHADIPQFVVEPTAAVREPTNHDSSYILADGVHLISTLEQTIEKKAVTKWLETWQQYEAITTSILSKADYPVLTEGTAVRVVKEALPEGTDLFVSNSMPVRDIDTFFHQTDQEVYLYANRGASGIDGITSTALGIAAAGGKRVVLMIGDLSFYHDLNGLLAAKKYQLDLTVILINNNGGGIFSFLPQSKEAMHFETLFGTSLDIDFEKAVSMYDGAFYRVTTEADLRKQLTAAHQSTGLVVLEVQTDRGENEKWHQALWNKVKRGLM